MPDSVSRRISVFVVRPFPKRYFPIHLEALPHIMASLPSALKMRMVKSASGIELLPIKTNPSDPMPL